MEDPYKEASVIKVGVKYEKLVQQEFVTMDFGAGRVLKESFVLVSARVENGEMVVCCKSALID